MVSPQKDDVARISMLVFNLRHKTSRPVGDQGGTAGDAAKSKRWNPARTVPKPGQGDLVPTVAKKVPQPFRAVNLCDVPARDVEPNKKRPGKPGRSLLTKEAARVMNP